MVFFSHSNDPVFIAVKSTCTLLVKLSKLQPSSQRPSIKAQPDRTSTQSPPLPSLPHHYPIIILHIPHLVLHIPHSRPALCTPSRPSRHHLHHLLNRLYPLLTNPCSDAPAQMPKGRAAQVLAHDGRHDEQLGVEQGKDAVGGEEEAVGYLGGYEC